MNNYKNKSVLIWDTGTFFPFAQKLAESFGKVFYFSSWANQSPKSNFQMIGTGFENKVFPESFDQAKENLLSLKSKGINIL